jgi:glycosyltransferase 2 family protein
LSAENASSRDRSGSFTLLVTAEPGRRNRRTIDAVLLIVLAFGAGLTAVIAASTPSADARVAGSMSELLGWAAGFWRTVFVATLIYAGVIIADVVWHRRWALARDIVVAPLAAVAIGSVLSRIVKSDWWAVKGDLLSAWGFPELRIACVLAVFAVAMPELVRPARIVAGWLPAFAAFGAVVIGAALPSSILGAFAIGLAAGTLVRFVFGSSGGVPRAEAIRAALAGLGVDVRELKIAERQHIGSTEYVGFDAGGDPLKARVLGRDAQDTQWLARRWRLLSLRDPPRSAPVGRLEQVEHEALATLMAAQAGVRVPPVVTAALSPDGDALIATRVPDMAALEESLPDEIGDETLEELWQQVARLHAAGISHGRLNAGNVLDGDAPMLVNWSAATLGAPPMAIDIDTAELLVSCAVLVGSDRALRAALHGVGSEAIAGALPYLQPAALTPHVRDLARHHDVALKQLRAEAAKATGAREPETAELRRFRLRDLVVTVFVGVAAYLLIKQLAGIGLDTLVDELRAADPAWVILGVVLAQLTFITDALSFRGAVAEPLPLGPCVALESAIKFINLTVPGSAGRFAINVRFLQRMGVPTPHAVGSGAIDGASETMIQVAIVLVTIPFVDLRGNAGRVHLSAPSGTQVAEVVALLAVVLLAIALVPSLHARIVPGMRSALSGLVEVVQIRRKRIELFGGNIATQMLYALTLGAAAQAYGVDLSLAQLLLINTAVSAFAGFIPVPGGVGAAEAGLTTGLVAVGVDSSTAFAIAITHRICTYFLPPIWGLISIRWLQRKAYV